MASASSSVLAQGANRTSVGRHATLQPVSSLRVKPFSTAKQSKGRVNNASVVGVRNVQRKDNSRVRQRWPLYAAETDPAVEDDELPGEDAADEDDDMAEYDLENEEFETDEAEAVVEFSDEQIEDRAFLTRQISQFADEASGETITTAEEDAAAADEQEGVKQLVDAVLKIETMSQKAEAGDANSPLPFSDEGLYDDVYETLGKMEAVANAEGPAEADSFDYLVLDAASESTEMPGSYPSAILDALDSTPVEEITFTKEEEAIMAAAEARPVRDDLDQPRGIETILDLLQAESEPLTAAELAMLEAAGEADLDNEDKQDFSAALEIAGMAAGLPSPMDLTSSGLYVLTQLTNAAKTTSGADFAAAAQSVLDEAKSSGSVSAAEFEQLAAAAAGLADKSLTLPTELFEVYDEKLNEVRATGTISEPAAPAADAALEAQVNDVLSKNAAALGDEFKSLESLLAGLQAPKANADARAQFLDGARALVGDAPFQSLLEESIMASHDPAQVDAARNWFLNTAADIVTPEQLTALSLVLAPEAAKPNEDVAPLPQLPESLSQVEAFINDSATEEGVEAAFDVLEKSPVPPVDYSLYIKDTEHPVYVEYTRLKAEVLEATGVDLDNVKVANQGVDPTLLQVVAQVLVNAAEGKDLNTDLDNIEVPEAPEMEAGTPLPADLEDIQKQLEAAWASQDISPDAPEEAAFEAVDDIDMSVPQAADEEDFDADAGFAEVEEDDQFFADEPAPVDVLAAVGEVDAAEESKWLQINDEDYAEAVEDVFGDFDAEDVSPEVALARAEAALQQFTSSGPAQEITDQDLQLLQTVVKSIVDLQASADPQYARMQSAATLVKLAQENTQLLEQAMATAGLYPDIIVPDNLTKDQAAQFVQAYGAQIIASLKAAEQKLADGQHVQSLAQALAQPVLKADEIDADAVAADLKALAKQVLSAEEIARIEADTPADYVGDEVQEAEDSEEGLTAAEILDLKARAAVKGAQLPTEVAQILVSQPTAEEDLDAVLAEMGIAPVSEAEPEVEAADVEAEAAAEVEASLAEVAPAGGEVDELAFAFSELLNDIVEEVKESAEDALYVEDAVMYQDDERVTEALVEDEDEEGVDVLEDELEVDADYEVEEAEAQALLEEVLADYAAQGKTEEEDDDVEDADEEVDQVMAADGAGDDDEGEAELQTMYNTTETQLLFDDYEDVWEAMGIPEARPKVPNAPRAKESDGEDEEAEEDEEAYEEEEESADLAEDQEADVADVIASYYAPDALDDGEDGLEPALAAPKTTLDLFGSAPYLEDDEDRAADDTSGLLERVTVSKTGDIFVERIIEVKRVTKVVKGGKIMSFRCVAIVGNRNGIVGVGVGSAREVVQAVQKACQDAKSSLIAVPLTKFDSTPHRVETKFKGSKVVINPAADGTGCIAGGAVRSVLELAGVKNCLAKRIGSRNPLNNARATIKALEMLQTWGEVAAKRGVPLSYLFARDEASATRALAGDEE